MNNKENEINILVYDINNNIYLIKYFNFDGNKKVRLLHEKNLEGIIMKY